MWTTVKKRPKKTPQQSFCTPEETAKFSKLKENIPHIVMPEHIRRIEKKIKIDNLSNMVLSEEWIDFQRQGWKYVRVIKPNEGTEIPDDDDHEILSLENGWGDVVLFKRVSRI